MTVKPATPGRRPSGLWVVIVLILIPPVVVPLWVPLYDKETPTLWGFPFFYWFQFLLILCSAVLTVVAYLISLVADRRQREVER
jgi:hypothetical protein